MNSGRHTHTSHIGRIRGPTVIPNEVGRSVEAIVEVGGSPGEALGITGGDAGSNVGIGVRIGGYPKQLK